MYKQFIFIWSLLILFSMNPQVLGKNNNKELADKSELKVHMKNAMKNPVDDPKLPRILLIGDSISIGYTVPVRKLLRDKANVHRVLDNTRYASYGLKNLDKWLKGKPWDVIHFNWGLWDICYRNPEAKTQGHRDKGNGIITATPEDYRKTLEKIVQALKKTNAKLIWCATTPVPEGEIGRIKGDEIKYNLIAMKIMRKNNIAINDLHAYILPRHDKIKAKKGDVHFSPKGYNWIAEKVVCEIEKMLPKATQDISEN